MAQIEQQWYPMVSCSHCGRDIGPGPHGFSHCIDHLPFSNPFGVAEQIAIKLFRVSDGVCDSFKHGIYTRRKQAADLINAALAAHAPAAGEGEPQGTHAERAEKLARQFHETYERLAPHVGYETRKASAVPWDNVPEKNKALMIATCMEILESLPQPSEHSAHVRELVKAARKAMEQIQLEFYDEAYEALDAALSHFEKGV